MGGTVLKKIRKSIAYLIIVCIVIVFMTSCGHDTANKGNEGEPDSVSADGGQDAGGNNGETGVDAGGSETQTPADSSGGAGDSGDSRAGAGDSAGDRRQFRKFRQFRKPNTVFAAIDFEDKTAGVFRQGGSEALTVTDRQM